MTGMKSLCEFRRQKAADLEGAFVREIEFLGEWVYLHLAFRGTDDGSAVVRVPLDGPLVKLQPAPGIYYVGRADGTVDPAGVLGESRHSDLEASAAEARVPPPSSGGVARQAVPDSSVADEEPWTPDPGFAARLASAMPPSAKARMVIREPKRNA